MIFDSQAGAGADSHPDRPIGLKTLTQVEWLIQLGQLSQASLLLEPALLQQPDWDHPIWIRGLTYLLRIFLETENHQGIQRWLTQLENVLAQKSDAPARLLYARGLIDFYQRNFHSSLQWAEKSLAHALEKQNFEDLAYALYLVAANLRALGKPQEALRELYNIQVIWNHVPNPEFKVSVLMLNAIILMDVDQVLPALDVLWQAYEELKNFKSALIPAQLMGLMAHCHKHLGNTALAANLLRLAMQMTDEINTPVLHRSLKKQWQALQSLEEKPTYDLIFDEKNSIVTERTKGRIEFKNQWLMLDLLKLFLQNPGKVFSKEDLVTLVWKEKYHPEVHDNKVYVTIKRLRQLIEAHPDKPQYIFRGRGGYFLNPDVRILWQKNLDQFKESTS